MSKQREIKEKIYKAMDSFLVEAKDQNGNDRSLHCLNKDRHLFVEEMEKILADQDKKFKQNIGFLRQWLNESRITDESKLVTNEEIEHFLTPTK